VIPVVLQPETAPEEAHRIGLPVDRQDVLPPGEGVEAGWGGHGEAAQLLPLLIQDTHQRLPGIGHGQAVEKPLPVVAGAMPVVPVALSQGPSQSRKRQGT